MTKQDLCSGIHDYPNVMESGEFGNKPLPSELHVPVTKTPTRCDSLGNSSSSSSQAQEINRNLLPLPNSLPSVSFASKLMNDERLLVDCNIEYPSREEKKATSFKPCELSSNDQMEYYSLEGFGGKRRHGIEGHSRCSIVNRVYTRYDSSDAGLDGLRCQTDIDVNRRNLENSYWRKTKSGCRKLQSSADVAPYYFKLDPSSASFILTPAAGPRNSEPTEDDKFTDCIEVNSEHC